MKSTSVLHCCLVGLLALISSVEGTGTFLTYSGSTGYSNLMYAIQLNSLKLVNFTSTAAGTLALIGNAILAIAGRTLFVSIYLVGPASQKSFECLVNVQVDPNL